MLGILLLFFIGKYFYELAQNYNKHRWLFAILGVVSYYFGTFLSAIVLILLDETFFDNGSFGASLVVIPFGIAFAYLVYFLLKRNWKKNTLLVKEEIDDIGKDLDNIRGFK